MLLQKRTVKPLVNVQGLKSLNITLRTFRAGQSTTHVALVKCDCLMKDEPKAEGQPQDLNWCGIHLYSLIN